jgi:transposase
MKGAFCRCLSKIQAFWELIEMAFNKILFIMDMKYPKETIEKAKQMAKDGKSIPEISEELGVLYNTIRVWVRGYCKTNKHPQETIDKAVSLAKQGYSKIDIAKTLNVPAGTVYKWNLPQPTEYREELKQKAREMVLKGISKIYTAYKLGVSSKSVYNWTVDIPRYKIPYPKKLKNKIRYLVRKGMSKVEVAEAMGVGYTTVTRWTTDLHNNDSKISGRYFLILCKLIQNGYIIADKRDLHIYKTLIKWIPNIKSDKMKGNIIYYLSGYTIKDKNVDKRII